jgi:hypothetical protein
MKDAKRLASSIRRQSISEPNAIVIAHDESCKVIVLKYPMLFPSVDVHAMQVVILGIAVVQADDYLFGDPMTYFLNLDLLAIKGCEIGRRVGIQVDAVQMPVLVTILVLEIDNLAIGVGPKENASSAHLVRRDRAPERSSAGPIQTFMTPSTGAMYVRLVPSGLRRGEALSGLPNNASLGMIGTSSREDN